MGSAASTLTKQQLRQQEAERARLQTGWIREREGKTWHRLAFEGPIGTTRCELVVVGERRAIPPAGALVCDTCTGGGQ